MINANQKEIFQTFQSCEMDAIARQNNCSLVVAADSIGLPHLIGEWKGAINP